MTKSEAIECIKSGKLNPEQIQEIIEIIENPEDYRLASDWDDSGCSWETSDC